MSCEESYTALLSGLGDKAGQLATKLCMHETNLQETADSLDGSFMLTNAYLVFFMHAGFAMLNAGSIRSKNCMNILLKNMLDSCFGAPVFFLFGFAFAYGKSSESNGFIGDKDFALVGHIDDSGHSWHFYMFQWAFAAATAEIVSGSMAERCSFQAYIAYSCFLAGFVYPVVVHWVWSDAGWLSAFPGDRDQGDLLLKSGMIDFAGCGVVHMVGGFAGLVGATILGPRTGRFDSNGEPTPNFGGHSMTMVVLGTFCLWFGWYGFNPGSMMAINGATNLEIVGRSAVTTTMSGAAGGVTSLLVNRMMNGHYDLGQVCNGVLCGLVAITSGCAVVEPGAALLAGFVAAFIFDFASRTLLKLRIDDPLCASPMHGFCGAWGLLFTGLFAKEQYVLQVYPDNSSYGLFYGGGGELLGCQVTGMVTIFAWVVGTMGPFFWILRKTGNLRASTDEEEMGLDVSHHGGYAYEQNGVGKNSL